MQTIRQKSFRQKQNSNEKQSPYKKLICSTNQLMWIRIHSEVQSSSTIKNLVLCEVQKCFLRIESYTMLMYLHFLSAQKPIRVDWQASRKLVIARKELVPLNQQIKLVCQQNQQTLFMLCHTLPIYLIKQKVDVNIFEIRSILTWLFYIEVKSAEQLDYVCNLIKIIRRSHLIFPDQVTKEEKILLAIIKLLTREKKQYCNLDMLFHPTFISQKIINVVSKIYSDTLIQFEEETTNIFHNLTINSLTSEILFLFEEITSALQANKAFYTLRILLQNYILPIFSVRFKAIHKLEERVYKLVQSYMIGLSSYASYSHETIDILLKNVEKIPLQIDLRRWLKLAVGLSEMKHIKSKKLEQVLISRNINEETLKEESKKQLPYLTIWNVTLRQARKTKKYFQEPSVLYKGMVNAFNDCYILTTVQSLAMTQQLSFLLEKYPLQNMPLLNELKKLFQLLGDNKTPSKNINVTKLKELGPSAFCKIRTQQDVQQYILELFTNIQSEMKAIPQMLDQFKKIFQIQYSYKIKCRKCNTIRANKSISYIHTYSYKQTFSAESVECIDDMVCTNCTAQNTIEITRTVIAPSIFMLHINRFSIHQQNMRKELTHKKIQRWIGEHELVGFICHQGKSITRGHYLYYAKIDSSKWVCFNDTLVTDFFIEEPDQEFQKEFRSDITPYVLFYRKKIV